MNTRTLLAASELPAPEARAVASLLLCSSTRRARQVAPFEQTRNKMQRRFKTALVRVLKFAKHETLRKLHRFMYANRVHPALVAADESGHWVTLPDGRHVLIEESHPFEGALEASKEDIAAGKIPNVKYLAGRPQGTSGMGEMLARYSYENGKPTVTLRDAFFDLSKVDKEHLLDHELGHEVSRLAFINSAETSAQLAPFKEAPWQYHNFAGFSKDPGEMIADVYAQALHTVKPLWEAGGKYQNFTNYVLGIADKAHLPLPSWYKGIKGRAIHGQDASESDAQRIVFNRDQLRQDLLEMLRTQLPDVVQSVADETLDAVGYRDPWQFPAQDTLDLLTQRENLISGVPDEIFDDIEEEISQGLREGESTEELSRRISGAFNQIMDDRAELIAQTETAAAYGFSSDAAAKRAGVQYKQWIHSGLPKEPREDHLDIDGLIVPIDEPYPVGDPPLMFPCDPDGSAEDVINCGCISIPATEEDYNAQEE